MAAVCNGMTPVRPCIADPWIGHIPFAYFVTQLPGNHRVVELGTRSGNSYFAFCQGFLDAGSTGEVVAVSSWEGDDDVGWSGDELYDEVQVYSQAHYSKFARVIRTGLAEALPIFADGSIDLLHINSVDECKDIHGVFYAWLPKVRQGGLILIHGIASQQDGGSLPPLWAEIEQKYRDTLSFFHSGGLGVLQVPGENVSAFDWLSHDPEEVMQIRQMFAISGMRMQAAGRQNQVFSALEQQLSTQVEEQKATKEMVDALAKQFAPFGALAESFQGSVTRDEYMKILAQPGMLLEWAVIAATNSFDRRWYSERYPDALAYKDGPLLHYLTYGRSEGRESAPFFLPHPPELNGTQAERSALFSILKNPPPSQFELQAEIARERSRKMERIINLRMPLADRGSASLKFSIVVHVFYLDVFRDIVQTLKKISLPYSLVITTPRPEYCQEIEMICRDAGMSAPEILVMENRGRDILPKLMAAEKLIGKCDVALFLHTKKSPHLTQGHGWLAHVMDCLCGSEHRVRQILNCFDEIPHLGMISPSTPELLKPSLNWGGNFAVANAITREAGFSDLPHEIDFPAGSMFWARPSALRLLIKPAISDMFEMEAGQLDGTIAHGIERLFFIACEDAGFEWFKIGRDTADTIEPALVSVEAFEDLMIYLEFAKKHLVPRRFTSA